jgi:hypothetical protein
MLPQFPEFKKLELSDRHDIEQVTSQYAPYSDFNFVSMWSYDTTGEMQVSELNRNLVVRFTDYVTHAPFYSFLGSKETTDTALKLFAVAEQQGLAPVLQLVPEVSLAGLDRAQFEATETPDHFDYILSLEKLADYEAHHLRHHTNFNRRFIEEHGEFASARVLDLHDRAVQEAIIALTAVWRKNKDEQKKSYLAHLAEVNERYVRIAEKTKHDNMVAVGVFHNDKLIGATISEMVDQDYFICHFMNMDHSFKGGSSYLVNQTCKEILKTGRKFINFEQDMGLQNLRQSKKTYEPVHFLKKYILKKI